MCKNLIVTVNYQNYKVTQDMIESYKSLLQHELVDVIVVDNQPVKDKLKSLEDFIMQHKLINIKIVPSETNLGYFGAFKYALDNFVNTSDYRNIIICNNDILFNDISFFQKLNSINYKYHVLAPSIRLLEGGKQQNPHRHYPPGKIRNFGYKIYFFSYILAILITILSKLKTRISIRKNEETELITKPIYSPHGACMIFSRDYFKEGGYIDNGYFLYGEEASVAAIAAENKFHVILNPELEVVHNEHQSTNFSLLSRRMYQFQKESYVYINDKYGVYKNS